MLNPRLGSRVKFTESGTMGTVVAVANRPEQNFIIINIVWDSDLEDVEPDAFFASNVLYVGEILSREEVLTSINPLIRALNDNSGYVPESNIGPPSSNG